MDEFIISSNKVLTPQGVIPAAILVRNGIIQEIQPSFTTSLPEVKLGNQLLMAGVVDTHVHINEPGRTDWEGFETATRAAIAGGITTLVEMPLNASPVTTSATAFFQKVKAAQHQLHCNCGFWAGIIPGNEQEIVPMAQAGVLGFKAFLTHSGIDEFPHVTRADLRKAMPIIKACELPLLVHAEIDDGLHPLHDTRSYAAYLASRPPEWEENAIRMMIELVEETGCAVHIVHLSAATALPLLRDARERKLPITVETAQHYLFFHAEQIPNGATLYKCAPPIREAANNEKLWEALQSGLIDFVATDHSPAPPDLKEVDSGNFAKAWGGIASLQLALPALWTTARKHNCSLEQLAAWLCEKPAELAQLKKGRLAPGYAADFVVWDPEETFTVDSTKLYHRHKLTPYAGQTLYGVVKQTWLNGKRIFHQGTFEQPASGHLITA